MTRRQRVATVLAFVAVGLTGCQPALTHGYVTSRAHRPARTEISGHFQCVSYNKNGGCTNNVWITDVNDYPETWTLCLRERVDGKMQTGCVDVPDERTFDAYPIGNHYPDPK